jgi:trigger factor
MQVTVDDVTSIKKIMHVEINEDKVIQEINDAYKLLKKTAKIKGFRPGKTPRSVLERMFKKDVHNDVSAKLLQDSFMEAIKKTDLNVVGNPTIDSQQFDEKGSFKYDVTLEVKPEIKNFDFKGLTLQKTLYKVTDEEIDAQLQMLQKNLARQHPILEDRVVQENDFVLIDYEGFKDAKPFSETQKTENITMKIGGGYILKSFDEKLIGMKPGDIREITINFPEDYFNKNLASQEITFKVKLHEIRKEVLPEIDDEFAKQFGQYEKLEDLKNAITDNLNQGYAKRVEQELNEQIFGALLKNSEFEIPESLVDYELEEIVQEAEKSFTYYNKSMEDLGLSRESLSEKYRDTAEKKVRRHFLLDKIIKQENITLTDEELEDGFKEMAQTVDQSEDEVKNYYQQNKDKVEFFKRALLEKKAIKLIIEHSNIEEVEPELMKNSENKKNDKS